MTLPADEVFTEESATPVVRSVALSQLSIELGHLYMDDFEAGPAHLLDQFRRVAPWAAAARDIAAAELTGKHRAPRISTCFLIDDYFTRFSTPDKVVRMLVSTAADAGLEIDYIARESGCAVADGIELARVVENHLVSEPPEGADGARPPVSVSGWLTNGERSPGLQRSAMAAPRQWQPPRQSAVQNHSIFLDIELWSERAGVRLWSCPFLAAVWQLQRLGLIRHLGEPVAQPEPMALDELPADWDMLPPVIQLNPAAAPFRAYRTFSVLGARFLPIEVAVRTILGQVAVTAAVDEQIRGRAKGERIILPSEFVDRIRYAFM